MEKSKVNLKIETILGQSALVRVSGFDIPQEEMDAIEDIRKSLKISKADVWRLAALKLIKEYTDE